MCGVVAEAVGGVPRAVDPQAVAGADTEALDPSVEDVAGTFLEAVGGLAAGLVEDAEVDRVGGLGVDGDVEAAVDGVDAEGVRLRAVLAGDDHRPSMSGAINYPR